jgi:competence protein ComEC
LAFHAFAPESLKIQLHFFDVGHGDAALITTPNNQNVLIDGGPNDVVSQKLDDYLPFYHRSLDAVILTHPHADHLVGLLKVLDQYEVKRVYLTGVLHTTPEYLEFLEKIKTKKIDTKAVKSGDEMDFGDGIKLEILSPLTDLSQAKVENLNNSSIVAKLVYGEKKVLFTGDLEKEGQEKLLAANADLAADLIKIPHHGSKDAGYERFLEKVNFTMAVISVGKDNKFGHPAPSTLSILRNVAVFRTDYDGDINFEMDQKNILPKK